LRCCATLTSATIVVEHRDRFASSGAEPVEAVLSAAGRRLLVVDPGEVDDDLAGDVTNNRGRPVVLIE